MQNKKTLIIGLVVLVALLAGAGLLYTSLSANFRPQTAIDLAEEERAVEENDQVGELDNVQPVDDDEEDLPSVFPAPDFSVVDAEGNQVNFSDYVGVPMVLNFWASWCGPCVNEMPHFNAVSQEYSEDELLFMMVNLTGGRETLEAGKSFIADNGYTFPVFYDVDSDAALTYGIVSIPTSCFIDKDGNIVAAVEGSIPEETLRRGIALIMDGE